MAFALKNELLQLGLFAFEYEDWRWVAAGILDKEPVVDRARLRQMLTATSVVVLISPHKGQASAGVQTEIEELRSCRSPVILLHWSPEGWHPFLSPQELEGLNLVWKYEGRTSGDRDVTQNECEHIARQLAVGSWLACQLHWLQSDHPRTAARLMARIPTGPYDPLLNYRLDGSFNDLTENDEAIDVDALAAAVAAQASESDLRVLVHEWRAGADLLAQTLSEEAKFSLARPVRTFYAACEALCQHAFHRVPELKELPGHVLRRRGHTLVRLNRDDEAAQELQRALAAVPEDERHEVYQTLAFAQRDAHRDKAILSLSHAIECAPDTETRCVLTYNRGVFRFEGAADRATAVEDFSYVLDHSTNVTLRHSALLARARTYTEDHRYEAALADYTQVLADAEATPRTAVSAWINRGGLYNEQGQFEEAIADWTEAINAADASQEQRFRTLEVRAQVFEKTGNLLAAATDYEAMTRYSAISREYREDLLRTIVRLRSNK